MATLNTTNIKHASSSSNNIVLNADGSTTIPNLSVRPNRNLIINGAMQVAERGDVSSVTSGYGGADRFKFDRSGAAVVTLKQDTGDITQGFAKAQRIDVTTADSSLAAGDYAMLSYRFEGQDLQQLKKGTANAQQVTLSFHIKSPKTGTHIVELVDQSNSGRHVNKAYTVSSANTWEKKTVTFPMETSNAITNDNARRMDLNWWLAAGSTYTSGTLQTSWGADTNANRAVGQVNTMDNTSNDIYITGVQLEVGSVATNFEHRSFGQELALCQRYFYMHTDAQTNSGAEAIGTGTWYNGYNLFVSVHFPTTMRTVPSLYQVSGTDYFQFNASNAASAFDGFNEIWRSNKNMAYLGEYNESNTTGASAMVQTNNTNARLGFNAEL